MITNYYLPEESEDIKLMKLPQKAKGRTKILGARGESTFCSTVPEGYWDANVQNNNYKLLVKNLELDDKDNSELKEILKPHNNSQTSENMAEALSFSNIITHLEYPDETVLMFLELRLIHKWSIKSIKAKLQISDEDIKKITK